MIDVIPERVPQLGDDAREGRFADELRAPHAVEQGHYEQFGTHLDPTALDSQAAVEAGEQIELELAVAPVRARRD